jgi:cytochrome P450
MRLSPPIGSALWREIVDRGCSIAGIQLPAGVEVGTCIYSIHHHSEYYPEPFAYRPERWIVSEATGITEENVDIALSAYNPFSLGPRSCIGKQLALNELMLTMAVILCNFDFRTPEGPLGKVGEGEPGAEWGRHRAGEYQLKDFVTAVKHGPLVEFKRRETVRPGNHSFDNTSA